jgi:Protein of unknown function (DUF1501)
MEPLTRRRLGMLSLGALGALASARLGMADDARPASGLSLIVLWLRGGPSQLETFDPKPGTPIGGPTRAIDTSQAGLKIAHHLPQVAEQMEHLALVRSVVGKEGDHERASIQLKTGRRPEVALTHPSIGAICAHELEAAGTEIPRYVSILGNDPTSRGGYLGQSFDPFRVGDPIRPIQDVTSPVGQDRQARRLEALSLLEHGFADGRPSTEARTMHQKRTAEALRTMQSPQLAAFDIKDEPSGLKRAYGDNPFGRGCLAARRLVEVGVRCVEVSLEGWDTHVNNFEEIQAPCGQLDPALATLVTDLRERGLWEHTVVFCGGEFGRTPKINRTDGRDHWPHAFSAVLGGGPIRGGQVIGETGPGLDKQPKDPILVADLYATLLAAVGLDPTTENMTSVGRPVKLSDGSAVERLLSRSG